MHLPRRLRILLGICTTAACSLALASPAMADFVVDDVDDTSDASIDGTCDATGADGCTLRAAIEEANATPALDTITFSVTGTHIALNVFSVNSPMVIDGNGSSITGTVVDGQDSNRLFSIDDAATPSVTFKDLRLANGHVSNPSGVGGPAILSQASLGLTNVVVTNNAVTGTGSGAGAIQAGDSTDTLTLTDSAVTGNTIASTTQNSGAGIRTLADLNLLRTTVSTNQITAGTVTNGGGIEALGDASIIDSTVTGNSVASANFGSAGGGLAVSGPTTSIVNSTISGNAAGTGLSGQGGGISLAGDATITNTTFANNVASNSGADLVNFSGTTTLKNTILASAGACTNGGGTLVSATPGNNLDVGTSCGLGTANGNLENTNPLLAALAPNTPGSTETHALQAGSPAINAATTDCAGLSADQRGFARPQGVICDIGSYERLQRTLTAAKSGTGTGTVAGTGINCGPVCVKGFEDASVVTLTATPAPGSTFTGWSGCDSVTTDQCTLTLGANRTATASFTLSPIPPAVAAPTANPACASLRKKLKKAKTRFAKKKIRSKLRKLGC